MNRLTRYILRQLAIGTVLVSLALLCVLWLTQSLRFVELIVNKGLSFWLFMKLTLLLLPNFLVVVLPISLFAVVLFAYNKLTTDREIVVMRAAGQSQWALAKPALILSGLAIVLSYWLSLFAIPASVRDFRELQWTVRNDVTGLLLQEGVFTQIGDGFTVFVKERNAQGELLGIMVHDKRNPHRPVTMMAERGALVHSEAGPRVLMVNGSRQEAELGSGRLQMLHFDSYAIELRGVGAAVEDRRRDPREWTTAELAGSAPQGLEPGDHRRAMVELHQRLTAPLYHLSFSMVALAALLSGSFNRRGQVGRVLAAVGVMVAVQAAALGSANAAGHQLSLIPLMWAMPLLPILGAAWVLFLPSLPRARRPAVEAGAA